MRIGFLFNHYAPHQVPHAAPYAFELSRRHPTFEVEIACASKEEMAVAQVIATLYPGQRCHFHRLDLPPVLKVLDSFINSWKLHRKRRILKQHLRFFRSLDALVTPERTSLKLRERYGLRDLRMIHTRHGAGDHEGGFDHRSLQFDFTLLPGKKYAERLARLGFLPSPQHYAIVGWPKFEVTALREREPKSFFANDKPVVVYNPHFKPHLSSWPLWGQKVLSFFADHPEFNLIFAPHVLLFKQGSHGLSALRRRFGGLPNILIDTGSRASIDMSYMLASDIYLGDVSSQVYEFLVRPRPCVFLNASKISWQDDVSYHSWTLGQVIDDLDQGLLPALCAAKSRHCQFIARQKASFAYTFHSEDGTTAAERGADAIAAYLQDASAGVDRRPDESWLPRVQAEPHQARWSAFSPAPPETNTTW